MLSIPWNCNTGQYADLHGYNVLLTVSPDGKVSGDASGTYNATDGSSLSGDVKGI